MPDNQEPPPSRRRLPIPPNFKGIFLRHPDKLAPSVPQPTLLNSDILKHYQPHYNPPDLSLPPPSSFTHSPESTPLPGTPSQKSTPGNNTTQSGRALRKFEVPQAGKRTSPKIWQIRNPCLIGTCIFVTADLGIFKVIDITGAGDAAFIRECIFFDMQVSDENQTHFSIYRTEIGSYAIGDALTDENLFRLCRDCGDACASLKFMISHTSAAVHEPLLDSSYAQEPREKRICVTADSDIFKIVDVTGARDAAFVRERIFAEMQVSDEDQVHFSIYRTEVGSRAIGEALADEHLFRLCQNYGNAYGSLKLMISYTSADIHESLQLDPSYTRWFYTVPPPVVVPRTNDIYFPAHPQHRRVSPQRSPSSASERLSQRGGRYNDTSAPDDNVDTPERNQNGITIQCSSAETSQRTIQPLAQQPPSAMVERGHAGAPLPHTEEPHLPSRSPQSLPPGDPEFPFTEDETSGGMVGTPVPINWAVSWIAPDGKAESKGSLTSPSLTYLSSRRKEDLYFVAMRRTTPRPFEPRRISVFQLIPPSHESHLGPHSAAKNTGMFPQIPAPVQSPTDQTEPNKQILSPPRRKLPKPPSSLNAHPNNRANVFNEDFDPPPEEMREALEVFPPVYSLDEPGVEASSGEASLASTQAVPPSPTPDRPEGKESIRVVTNEHQRELYYASRVIPGNYADMLRKGGARFWGGRMEEVPSEQVKNASPTLFASAGSPSELERSPVRIDTSTPICTRLINRPTSSPPEVISLIEVMMASKVELGAVYDLCRDDTQTLIDVIHEAMGLPNFPSRLRGECLRALCRICGHRGLLPKSLHVPRWCNRSDRPLYRGGFADVWKGEFRGGHVAVKELRVYSNANLSKIARRFCKEVVTWNALRHPNVLQLLGISMDKNHFAMVSEWMVNGNINEFIEGHREANRFELLKGVANGLMYMHSQGMIHGDLKGANILIDQDERARLADFGLLTIASDPTVFTASSSIAARGTTRWMSPELIDPEYFGLDNSPPTKESDCYALGMVVYEVLSGRAPFATLSHMVVAREVVKGKRPTMPEGAEGELFADDLWEILGLCWATEPTSRPDIKSVFDHFEQASGSWKPPLRANTSAMEGGSEWDLSILLTRN